MRYGVTARDTERPTYCKWINQRGALGHTPQKKQQYNKKWRLEPNASVLTCVIKWTNTRGCLTSETKADGRQSKTKVQMEQDMVFTYVVYIINNTQLAREATELAREATDLYFY